MREDARYTRRSNRLKEGRTTAKSSQLKAAYERADEMTDAAMHAYLRLVEAAEAQSAAYQAHADAVVQSITNHQRELIERADAIVGRFDRGEIEDAELQAERSSILLDVMTEQARAARYTSTNECQAKRVVSVSRLSTVLWEKIIDIEDKDFSKEVAIKAVEAGIGLLPGLGSLYGVGKSMLELGSFHTSKIKTADELLLFLNGYAESLDAWWVATETLIRRLEADEFDA